MNENEKFLIGLTILLLINILILSIAYRRKCIQLDTAIDEGEEILQRTSHLWQKRHRNLQNELKDLNYKLTYVTNVNIQLNKQRDSNAAMYLEEKKSRLNIIEDYKKRLDDISKLNKINREAFECIEKQDKKIALLKQNNISPIN